ncbi:hypothetical protein, partial [Paenibacillus physcomitrellae]|uniref:hypothetical protein n=1 Tax=Paenibacillus physcomitrellae TaxID=1619311 RepID=UPI001E646928
PLGLFHPKYLNLFLTRCSVFKDQTFHFTSLTTHRCQLLYHTMSGPVLQAFFENRLFSFVSVNRNAAKQVRINIPCFAA